MCRSDDGKDNSIMLSTSFLSFYIFNELFHLHKKQYAMLFAFEYLLEAIKKFVTECKNFDFALEKRQSRS